MIEWPTAIPIDLDTYPRRQWYEHFCQFEIPLTYRTIQIDVTALKLYCKQHNLKFSLTIGFILTRASNHVNEFRHRIEGDKPVVYNKVIPSFTVMSKDKVFAITKGVYTESFASDYRENLSINDNVANGLELPPISENQGQIFITVNPWTTQTAVQAPYTKRFASVPVFCVGKMYDDNGRIKVGLGLQVHHGLVDGYHIGHFVHILERHLEDPTLLEGPYVSTFDQPT
ncbi:MAG: hypothetical protein RLZZ273_839 [Bacteroidota bacterium]|jgi:chloramphenicol O-acetyltransferase type A